MTRALDGKSAIITGGGGGFGKAIARRLVRDGARVLLTGRSLARLEAARARLLTDMPDADIAVLAGDAGDEQAVQAAVAAAGGGVLDIFIGTVGGGSGYGPIENVALDDFMADYRSNAASAFLAIKHGAPRMCDGGSFVFVSSTAAKLSFNRLASYCAAKAGLEQLVRVAANELGSRGIRVNCVRPWADPYRRARCRFRAPRLCRWIPAVHSAGPDGRAGRRGRRRGLPCRPGRKLDHRTEHRIGRRQRTADGPPLIGLQGYAANGVEPPAAPVIVNRPW